MGVGGFIHGPLRRAPHNSGPASRQSIRVWVPACAGNTDDGGIRPTPRRPLRASLRAQRSNPGDWAGLLVMMVKRVARSTVSGPLGCFGVIRLAMTRVKEHPRSIHRVPHNSGPASRQSVRVWIPAFAGNTDDGKQGPLRRFAPLPPEGEDLGVLNLPPLGEVPAKPG